MSNNEKPQSLKECLSIIQETGSTEITYLGNIDESGRLVEMDEGILTEQEIYQNNSSDIYFG